MIHVVFADFSSSFEEEDERIASLVNRLGSNLGCTFSRVSLRGGRGQLDEEISAHRAQDVRIMPLLVQEGHSYQLLLETGCRCGRPLLSGSHDIMRVASILSSTFERKPDTGHVIVAHGREDGHVDQLDALSHAMRDDMRLVTLKGAPGFDAHTFSMRNLVVVPLLLTCGHHARNDIAMSIVPALECAGHDVTMVECGLLGLSSGFEAMFMEHLEDLVSEEHGDR